MQKASRQRVVTSANITIKCKWKFTVSYIGGVWGFAVLVFGFLVFIVYKHDPMFWEKKLIPSGNTSFITNKEEKMILECFLCFWFDIYSSLADCHSEECRMFYSFIDHCIDILQDQKDARQTPVKTHSC